MGEERAGPFVPFISPLMGWGLAHADKGGNEERQWKSGEAHTVVINEISHRDAEKGGFEAGVETCDSLTGYDSAGGVIGGGVCSFGFDLGSCGEGDERVAVCFCWHASRRVMGAGQRWRLVRTSKSWLACHRLRRPGRGPRCHSPAAAQGRRQERGEFWLTKTFCWRARDWWCCEGIILKEGGESVGLFVCWSNGDARATSAYSLLGGTTTRLPGAANKWRWTIY